MFRSVVVSHDGSRCLEGTVQWLSPLLGTGHSHVELYARQDAAASSELNSRVHLEELSGQLTEAGADVEILPLEYDLIGETQHKLVIVHSPDLALKLLHDSTASILFTPEGVSPHKPERVLVPLDGSSRAEQILPLLVPLCRAFKPKVELLRIEDYDMPGQGSLMARTTDPTRHALLESLEAARQFLEENGIDAISHAAKPGKVSRRILETAAKDQADLIAVSTHGHNRVFRWLFGSCADTLIKSGTTPILVRNTRKGTSGVHKIPLQRVENSA